VHAHVLIIKFVSAIHSNNDVVFGDFVGMFTAISVRLLENLLFCAISVVELDDVDVGATVAWVDSSSH